MLICKICNTENKSNNNIYYPKSVNHCVGFLGDKTEPFSFYMDEENVYEYSIKCKTGSHCGVIDKNLLKLKENTDWIASDCSNGIEEHCEEYSNAYEKIRYEKNKDFFGDFVLSHWYKVPY